MMTRVNRGEGPDGVLTADDLRSALVEQFPELMRDAAAATPLPGRGGVRDGEEGKQAW